MKRQLTLPLLEAIFKPLPILFWILFTSLITVIFFPTFPAQLTLTDQHKKQTHLQCPKQTTPLLIDSTKQLSTPFTLLNWNIYKQQKQGWVDELQQLSEAADIITLQEAKLSPELMQFSKQKQFFYHQNYAFKYDGFIHGVNTLSKVQPNTVCGSSLAEPWVRVPKTAIATTYPIQHHNATLLVINLHGINFTFNEKDLHMQLIPYLALLAEHDGPAVFSGDFNTWSDDRLVTVQQPLATLGFSEVRFTSDERLTIFGLPLDHIYFRGLKVIKAESLTTNASDHTPQIITFDIEI